MKRSLAILFFSLALFAARSAGAAALWCGVQNVTPLAFGVYEPGNIAGSESHATLTVSCILTLWGSVRVELDAGSHSTGGWNRHLASGSSRLAYQLYLDPARTQIFGDGTGGSNAYVRSGGLQLLSRFDVDIYGYIPPGQYVPGGTYTDTIQVRIIY